MSLRTASRAHGPSVVRVSPRLTAQQSRHRAVNATNGMEQVMAQAKQISLKLGFEFVWLSIGSQAGSGRIIRNGAPGDPLRLSSFTGSERARARAIGPVCDGGGSAWNTHSPLSPVYSKGFSAQRARNQFQHALEATARAVVGLTTLIFGTVDLAIFGAVARAAARFSQNSAHQQAEPSLPQSAATGDDSTHTGQSL